MTGTNAARLVCRNRREGSRRSRDVSIGTDEGISTVDGAAASAHGRRGTLGAAIERHDHRSLPMHVLQPKRG
jgi:hypothetical protein